LLRGLGEHIRRARMQELQIAVSGWRREAAALKIPKAEQDLMAAAFE